MKNALTRLREIAPKLNKTTDQATEVVRRIEHLLAKEMQIGIQADVRVSCKNLSTDRDIETNETTYLAFQRINGLFRIVVRTEAWQGNVVNGDGDSHVIEETPWLECSRGVKLETYPKLPDLLEELTKEAERTIEAAESAHPEVQKVLELLK